MALNLIYHLLLELFLEIVKVIACFALLKIVV